ncbi:UNVERIFIED_CONTAM: Serine/threonine-protein phosphatase 2A regulatory subunit B'' subunit alpha [Siphonaria sp. JEL0065]|nr:Serine/threonine-protein phosphatase 2A regulatory subunit B'' subunit alpha [Siphonaria sp. JEL0065]
MKKWFQKTWGSSSPPSVSTTSSSVKDKEKESDDETLSAGSSVSYAMRGRRRRSSAKSGGVLMLRTASAPPADNPKKKNRSKTPNRSLFGRIFASTSTTPTPATTSNPPSPVVAAAAPVLVSLGAPSSRETLKKDNSPRQSLLSLNTGNTGSINLNTTDYSLLQAQPTHSLINGDSDDEDSISPTELVKPLVQQHLEQHQQSLQQEYARPANPVQLRRNSMPAAISTTSLIMDSISSNIVSPISKVIRRHSSMMNSLTTSTTSTTELLKEFRSAANSTAITAPVNPDDDTSSTLIEDLHNKRTESPTDSLRQYNLNTIDSPTNLHHPVHIPSPEPKRLSSELLAKRLSSERLPGTPKRLSTPLGLRPASPALAPLLDDHPIGAGASSSSSTAVSVSFLESVSTDEDVVSPKVIQQEPTASGPTAPIETALEEESSSNKPTSVVDCSSTFDYDLIPSDLLISSSSSSSPLSEQEEEVEEIERIEASAPGDLIQETAVEATKREQQQQTLFSTSLLIETSSQPILLEKNATNNDALLTVSDVASPSTAELIETVVEQVMAADESLVEEGLVIEEEEDTGVSVVVTASTSSLLIADDEVVQQEIVEEAETEIVAGIDDGKDDAKEVQSLVVVVDESSSISGEVVLDTQAEESATVQIRVATTVFDVAIVEQVENELVVSVEEVETTVVATESLVDDKDFVVESVETITTVVAVKEIDKKQEESVPGSVELVAVQETVVSSEAVPEVADFQESVVVVEQDFPVVAVVAQPSQVEFTDPAPGYDSVVRESVNYEEPPAFSTIASESGTKTADDDPIDRSSISAYVTEIDYPNDNASVETKSDQVALTLQALKTRLTFRPSVAMGEKEKLANYVLDQARPIFFPLASAGSAETVNESYHPRRSIANHQKSITLKREEFEVVTICCRIPRHLTYALHRKCLAMSPDATKSGKVSWQEFELFVESVYQRYNPDVEALAFEILKSGAGGGGKFLVPDDFKVFVEDVLENNSAFAFLASSPDFQARFTETVIVRLFYSTHFHGRNRLSLRDFRTAGIYKIIADIESATNSLGLHIPPPFSYKDFYVIYCAFWELDKDHDMYLTLHDLERYSDRGLSHAALARVIECYGRIPVLPEGESVDETSGGGSPSTVSMLAKNRIKCFGFKEFVAFIMSVEDKTSVPGLYYWFRVLDIDEDGLVSLLEIETFWEHQYTKVPEQYTVYDFFSLIIDLIRPTANSITLLDLKRNSKAAGLFLDFLLDSRRHVENIRRSADVTFRLQDEVWVTDDEEVVVEASPESAAPEGSIGAVTEIDGNNRNSSTVKDESLSSSEDSASSVGVSATVSSVSKRVKLEGWQKFSERRYRLLSGTATDDEDNDDL